MNIRRFMLAAIAGVASALVANTATAATTVTYVVDPTRSALTASGTWGTQPLIQQTSGIPPGSNTLMTEYSGTIVADRDIAANTLQILGGSLAAQNGGYYGPQFSPANYGFATAFGPPTSVRDFVFSPSSPIILSPNSFDASQISADITSGAFDYAVFNDGAPPVGSLFHVPIVGNLALAQATGALIDVGGVETLTIPVDTTFTIQANGQPLNVHLAGAIVATTAVPEPATIVVIVFSTGLLLLRRRRKQLR